jgi:hypothetical protein
MEIPLSSFERDVRTIMRSVTVSGIRCHIILLGILTLFYPAPGNALPSAPVLGSLYSADYGRSPGYGSFPSLFSPEISIRKLEDFPYMAGRFPAAIKVEGMFDGPSAGPETGRNDRLSDMLIPLFIGSILIGFAGVIRRIGTGPDPVERFARMDAEVSL